MIEELEAANEELHSANEESLSSNEELQSLNEELETSKEEIQASNEELLVVNAELQQRNAQLQEARDFADAIVETIREPLLVLDADLRVQRANRAFYQCFQVEPAETERRRIFELGDGQWNILALRTLLEDLLPTNNSFVDYEVEHTFPGLVPGPCCSMPIASIVSRLSCLRWRISPCASRRRVKSSGCWSNARNLWPLPVTN